MFFIDNLKEGLHSSWSPFFTPAVEQALLEIERKIAAEGREYTPDPSNVLRFLSLDLFAVKVLILGQDPYPQKGRATGRAFEVGGLTSWMNPFENASLRNIVRSIYSAYSGNIRLFTEIRTLMEDNLFEERFQLLPPDKLFENWERQGVLLLNSSFTCEIDGPASHSPLWQPFTQMLLKYINDTNPEIIWFIWGNHAQKAIKNMDIKKTIVSAHPMLSSPKPNDIVYGVVNPFEATKSLIDWR